MACFEKKSYFAQKFVFPISEERDLLHPLPMSITELETLSAFVEIKQNKQGKLMLVGSGRYFRSQKIALANRDRRTPYHVLYQDQVREMEKESAYLRSLRTVR